MISEKKFKRTIMVGDLHIPYHDKKALELWFNFVKFYRPEVVILNGDIMDCFSISKFTKSPLEGKRLKEEIDETKKFLTRLVKATPGATRYYIFGN